MPRRRVEIPTFAPQEIRKRVVLQTRDGRHHIVGIFDPSIHTMEEFVTTTVKGRHIPVGLVRITTRVIWYREIVPPSDTRAFHPEQK